jgi:putative flippase GtrA
LIQHFFSREFIGFLIAGGIAAMVNFLSRIYFNQYVSFSSSVLLAYLVGMVTAFILAKLFVFKASKQSIRRSVLFFIFVNVLAIAQTWLISMGFNFYILPALGFEKYVPEISSAIGIVFPVFTSYLGHKHWSFK